MLVNLLRILGAVSAKASRQFVTLSRKSLETQPHSSPLNGTLSLVLNPCYSTSGLKSTFSFHPAPCRPSYSPTKPSRQPSRDSPMFASALVYADFTDLFVYYVGQRLGMVLLSRTHRMTCYYVFHRTMYYYPYRNTEYVRSDDSRLRQL